jgi:hypothetical protein
VTLGNGHLALLRVVEFGIQAPRQKLVIYLQSHIHMPLRYGVLVRVCILVQQS